jgi:hypothetical protein
MQCLFTALKVCYSRGLASTKPAIIAGLSWQLSLAATCIYAVLAATMYAAACRQARSTTNCCMAQSLCVLCLLPLTLAGSKPDAAVCYTAVLGAQRVAHLHGVVVAPTYAVYAVIRLKNAHTILAQHYPQHQAVQLDATFSGMPAIH